MIQLPVKLFASVAVLCAVGGFASAHSTGQSFEKTVNGYVIDVGFDAVDLVAGEPVRFDAVLWSQDRSEMPDFTDVWVRLVPVESGIVFAGNIHRPVFGSTGMTYVFPKGGDYELTVRFQTDGEQIAEASFPLSVGDDASNTSGSRQDALMGIFIGIFIGSITVWFLKRKRK